VAAVLFVIIFFGGGMLFALSKTEIGHAIADRIRGQTLNGSGTDPMLVEELDRVREQVGELAERVEFTERLLAKQRDDVRLSGGAS
jgi:hypothetical protein